MANNTTHHKKLRSNMGTIIDMAHVGKVPKKKLTASVSRVEEAKLRHLRSIGVL